jgi:hypothetical protein
MRIPIVKGFERKKMRGIKKVGLCQLDSQNYNSLDIFSEMCRDKNMKLLGAVGSERRLP